MGCYEGTNIINTHINNKPLYFLDKKKLETIQQIYINKYFLRKILYEFTPLIMLSFFHLNNGSILVLSFLQIALTKNFLNLVTCSLFFMYFNLGENLLFLKIYGGYLVILFIIEAFLVYEYMEINTNFLALIGFIFSLIFFYQIEVEKKDFICFLSFLVASTGVIPFNINNTLTKIKKEKDFDNVMNSSYALF
jgi:hypothetical protein